MAGKRPYVNIDWRGQELYVCSAKGCVYDTFSKEGIESHVAGHTSPRVAKAAASDDAPARME